MALRPYKPRDWEPWELVGMTREEYVEFLAGLIKTITAQVRKMKG